MFPDLASDPAGNSQGLEGHQHNRALFACSPPSLRTQAAGTVDCKTCPCLHAVWWEWPVTYITLENSTHHRVTRQMQAWMWHATRRELPAPVETAKKRPLPHTGQEDLLSSGSLQRRTSKLAQFPPTGSCLMSRANSKLCYLFKHERVSLRILHSKIILVAVTVSIKCAKH